MPQTTLFLGPMARKKRVDVRYEPNSYRVISQDAENSFESHPRTSLAFTRREDYNIIAGQAKDLPPSKEYRHNQPNPRHVGFLSQDVRLLNEPVCDVYTENTKAEQYKWWNHQSSSEKPSTPSYRRDTTFRNDFQFRESGQPPNSRHTSNPHTAPALGCVPVNMMRVPKGNQRLWKEGISYEHQYNCRLDPQYPIRAKRHGAFVWDEMPPKEADKLVQQYGNEKPNSSQSFKETTPDNYPPVPNTSTLPVLPPIAAL